MRNPLKPPVLGNARPDSGWSGMGEAWSYLSYIIAGVAVWGLIGYGLDSWMGTRPVFFVIGALVGNFAGIYLVYLKAFGPTRRPTPGKAAGRAP